MSNRQVIARLSRVLAYYHKQFDLLVTRLKAQGRIVAQTRVELGELETQLTNSQEKLASTAATIANRLMGSRFDSHAQQEIHAKRDELQSAESELQTRKTSVYQQKLKIETMEKLIERKSAALALELEKRQQVLADERYLSSTWWTE